MLGGGFAFWRRRPAVMALGLIPAAIAGLIVVAGFVALGFTLPGIATALTPFAEDWPAPWEDVARFTAGTAVVVAALMLVAISFTALTLFLGEPFYDRIWRAVETDLGDPPADSSYGFWRALGDGLSLVARGLVIALAAALLGLLPVVGGLVGGTTAVLLTGWLLADELAARALAARGLTGRRRRVLRRRHRARVLGFGVATQLCFLVPLGAVATMPAAVAGATLLSRSLLEGEPENRAEPRPETPTAG